MKNYRITHLQVLQSKILHNSSIYTYICIIPLYCCIPPLVCAETWIHLSNICCIYRNYYTLPRLLRTWHMVQYRKRVSYVWHSCVIDILLHSSTVDVMFCNLYSLHRYTGYTEIIIHFQDFWKHDICCIIARLWCMYVRHNS